MRLEISLILVLSVSCFVYSAEEGDLFTDVRRAAEELTGRVVGGKNANIKKHPYQVSLQFIEGNKGHHFCGGAIYNEEWIITAAHCIITNDLSRLQVVSGSTKWTWPKEISALEKIIIHEHFGHRGMDSDIALIKLLEPLTFGRKVNKLALPSQGQTLPGGKGVLTTGWGKTHYGALYLPSTLQKVKLKVVEYGQCEQVYGPSLTPNMICAHLTNMGSCNGDSGGPLVRKEKLVGIVSWGKRKCGEAPSVYTNVANFVDWIKDKTSQN